MVGLGTWPRWKVLFRCGITVAGIAKMTDLDNPQMGELLSSRRPLAAWEGQLGKSYTTRNVPTIASLEARKGLWRDILAAMNPWLGRPMSILEVGANVGQNLMALRSILPGPVLHGGEPNPKARELLQEAGFDATLGVAQDLPFAPSSLDLVFSSGVLIHIPDFPGDGHMGTPLYKACKEIVRVSKRWVVAIEYFSAEPREVTYRGRDGLLWSRDFGQYYIDKFNLEPIACGFAWKALTGLDDLTWWVLRKR